MKAKLFLLSSIAALSVMLAAGCIAPILIVGAAGAGSYAYFVGSKLVVAEAATLEATWNATEAAFQDLQLTPGGKEKNNLTARMEARSPKKKLITVRLENKGEKVTEIQIKVGTFGDEAYSRKIWERIKAHL